MKMTSRSNPVVIIIFEAKLIIWEKLLKMIYFIFAIFSHMISTNGVLCWYGYTVDTVISIELMVRNVILKRKTVQWITFFI